VLLLVSIFPGPEGAGAGSDGFGPVGGPTTTDAAPATIQTPVGPLTQTTITKFFPLAFDGGLKVKATESPPDGITGNELLTLALGMLGGSIRKAFNDGSASRDLSWGMGSSVKVSRRFAPLFAGSISCTAMGYGLPARAMTSRFVVAQPPAPIINKPAAPSAQANLPSSLTLIAFMPRS
jgi:hypothetical protein